MKKVFLKLALILAFGSCSNTPDLESEEVKSLQLLKTAINQSNKPKIFIDSRQLLSREQIDAAKMPILFVELESGQNGTLTPYPGQGVGQTWLGADGATITLNRGIVKASRGMGNDIMGSTSSTPEWSKVNNDSSAYGREISYITGNNKIFTRILKCTVKKSNTNEVIEIWKVQFLVTKFKENCNYNGVEIINTYYVDDQEIVRKSSQYHSDEIGFITIERLDR